MADKYISQLTAASALDGSELLEGEQAAAGVKLTAQQVGEYLFPSGAASPEGVVTRPAGFKYWQTDVGNWTKNSGSGNTGWVQDTSIE